MGARGRREAGRERDERGKLLHGQLRHALVRVRVRVELVRARVRVRVSCSTGSCDMP